MFCSFHARKRIPWVVAADQDCECASIRMTAKIPIGNCYSSHNNSSLKLIQMDYVRSPNCECNPSIKCTHISNPLVVRQCVKSTGTTDHATSSTHVKRNEKCNCKMGRRNLPGIFFPGSCNIFNLIGSFGASIMSLQQHFWLNFMIMALLLLPPTSSSSYYFSLAPSYPFSLIKIFPVYTENRKIRIQRFVDSACARNLSTSKCFW